MESASATGAMLQGPSSLPSHDADDSNDFIVINGESGTSYEEPDVDLFSSLSQPDAVAQIKDLLSQRNVWQGELACYQTFNCWPFVCFAFFMNT